MKAPYAFVSLGRRPVPKSFPSMKGVNFVGSFGKIGGLQLHKELRLAGDLSIETDEVDTKKIMKKVTEMSRKAAFAAAVPAIRMKLIAPISAGTKTAQTTNGVTWGIKAVGADSSPCTGKGIVVAVLDSGIDKSQPAFSNVKLVEKDYTGEGN